MKKLIAAAMAAMMAIGCAAAVAEEETPVVVDSVVMSEEDVDSYAEQLPGADLAIGTTINVTLVPPTGYTVEVWSDDPDELYVTMMSDSSETIYDLLVTHSEIFTDVVTLNETLDAMTEDEMAEMKETLTADYNDATLEIRETAMGTKLIVINENGAESDYADILTIYHGYFVQVRVTNYDAQLTDEEVQAGIDVLSSMAFTAEAAQ